MAILEKGSITSGIATEKQAVTDKIVDKLGLIKRIGDA